MTHEDFISIVRKPESVRDDQIADLKELIHLYPYFAPAQLFHVKVLKKTNSIQFAANLKVASLYCSSRRWLYYYLNPDKLISSEPCRRDRDLKPKSGGDYFDMINFVESEGGDTKQSLKSLAERLKQARSVVGLSPVSSPPKLNQKKEELNIVIQEAENLDLKIKSEPAADEISEDNAKKLIIERKYAEAVEILRVLNLNNPKKSVYFADQIRFLEKVIANSKK